MWRWMALACAVLSMACARAAKPPTAPSALLDKLVPKFRRHSIGGAKIDTAALQGRVVVIKFIAKYCEPCKKSLPKAQQLHRDNPDIAFIGIAEDEYQSDVKQMIASYGVTFPVIHDRGNVLAGRFRVDELPRNFVADQTGTIRWVGDGRHDEGDLEAAVRWAVAGAKP